MASLVTLLDRLEAAKRQFGAPAHAAETGKLLAELGARRFPDAASLIRFHEALLFFRAYPANAAIVHLADQLLNFFPERLRRSSVDLEAFEEPDVSGISGTAFSAIFSFDITRWLAARHPADIDIDWDATDPSLLGPLLRLIHPFYAEDALVEANIPHLEWFRAARKGRGSDLSWLLSSLQESWWGGRPRPRGTSRSGSSIPRERGADVDVVRGTGGPPHFVLSDLFAGAKIAVRWNLGRGPLTRSNLRLPKVRKFFFHDAPLLRRSDVSLADELNSPPIAITKLSLPDGEQFLDLARETSAMRYRELHGFTYGDPTRVIHAEFGRGVEVFVSGVPPQHRLPLRAYHAGMFFKNAVPIGYIECLTLFERMEVGFNLYYTFREGETAWLYAKLLRLFRQLLSVNCFAVDPYQIGLHNDEAIDSGAFWFYRKLGFRPVSAEVAKLLASEEKKLRARADYRTPTNILRRLAKSGMIYEGPGSRPGAWDHLDAHRMAMSLDRSPFPPAVQRAKQAPDESHYVRMLEETATMKPWRVTNPRRRPRPLPG